MISAHLLGIEQRLRLDRQPERAVDLHDVLALAELRGTLPADTVALGLQPERVEMIAELSEPVAAGVDGLVAMAIEELAHWGHVLTPAYA